MDEPKDSFNLRNKIGLALGPAVCLLLLLLPAPEGLDPAAWHTAAIGALMAIWWISEAIPIPVTALLPLALFPLFGILPIDQAAAPYANPLIFLFMGGFLIAIAMQAWNLHRRIALNIVRFIGVRPASIVFGFMVAAAFLSMWVSNTATALMMLPIALSVIQLSGEQVSEDLQSAHAGFGICLVLSIAYGCNIGGMGTIIGTPPNAFLAGFLSDSYGYDISFVRWMAMGVPLVGILIPVAYGVLTRITFPLTLQELPGGEKVIHSELEHLGPMSAPEKRVALVFAVTALLWMFRPLVEQVIPGISDAGIAMAAGVALFIIPANLQQKTFLLNWRMTDRMPWGVLILFGGGLSLANAISETGFDRWIGSGVGVLEAWPVILLLLLVAAMVVFLTEITSNTATAAAFLPILASVAIGIGQDPLLFTIPAVFAASAAFMLPVATPPNAIVYGSGLFSIPQMARAGLWLNLLFVVLITLFGYFALSLLFGVETGVVPPWVNS